jgi:hypothetical protein
MGWFSSSTAHLLQRPDTEGQLQLLTKLCSKAESADGAQQLLLKHPDCLSVVVKLLHSSNVAVQEDAAMVLGRIAAAGPTYQHQVVQCDGAVAGLVGLLHCSAAAVQRVACWALRHLVCRSPEAQDRVGQEPHAIERLAALLKSSQADVQLAAARAVVNLTDWSPSNSQRFGQGSDAIESLAAMLGSSVGHLQCMAAGALGNMALNSPANSKCVSQVPGVVDCMLRLLSSTDAYMQWKAAFAIASASEFSGVFQQALQAHLAAVGTALCNFDGHSESDVLEKSLLLHRLAAGSTGLRQSMAGSREVVKLVIALEQRLQDTPDNMAAATLKLLLANGKRRAALNHFMCLSKVALL